MIIQHFRYAVRMLWRSPVFASVAILTFALAIGATTAVFSQVRATILAPLPFPEADRLVSVWPSGGSLARSAVSVPTYYSIKDDTTVFADVAALGGQSQNLTGGGEPERVQVAQVTESLLAVMKSRIARGRWFLAEEDAPSRSAVAVLSHGLWMRRFGGDPGILGRTILLNAVPRLVVGIMAPEAQYPERSDVWIPIAFTPEQRALSARGSEYLTVIARLRPGVSIEQARASLDALGQRLRTVYGIKVNWTIRCATLDDDLRGDLKPFVLLAFCAVALVFLIACANIANLMLARAGDRRREFALRIAVGAAPHQIRAQSLVEASTLAIVGGAAGLLLAAWLSPLSLQLGARARLALPEAGIDPLVLLFGFGATLASAVITGILPSWQVSRASLLSSGNELLGHAGRGAIGARLKPALVIAEVALAFVVVVSAALLVKSLVKLTAVDPGFVIDERLTVRLTLPVARYSTRPQRHEFYTRFFEELRAVPDVRAAGGVSELPLSNQRNMATFEVEHKTIPPGQPEPHADMRSATSDYFEAMGIRLLRGRAFDGGDRSDSRPVAVVDDAVVRQVFGDEDPIGKRVALGIDPDTLWREIVGVVGAVKHDSLEAASRGAVYVPLAQRPTTSVFAVLRTEGDPMRTVTAVRAAVKRLDPDLPLYDVATLRGRLNDSVGRREMTAVVVGTFAALALVLALTGVYGVIAYAVTQRTKEIGVRMALGAQTTQVLWLFVRSSALTSLSGIALGAVLAFPLMQAGATLLFHVVPYDPAVYLISAAGFVLLSVVVSLISARRAATVDPLVALRN